MNPRLRQRLLLSTLGILLAWVAWTRLPEWGGEGRAVPPPVRVAGGRATGPGTKAPAAVLDLDLAALAPRGGDYRPGRDPFRFGPPPAPPPSAVRPAPPPPVAPARPLGPVPPPVDLTYLGSFGPPAGPIAVLTDNAAIYNARVGEVIKKKFVLLKIGYESVDLGFVGFPEAPATRLAVGR